MEGGNGREGTTTDPSGDAVADFLGRAAPESENEDVVGGELIGFGGESLDHRLDQCGRLAGARTGQNQQCATPVCRNSLLLGIELWRLGARDRGGIQDPTHVAWIPRNPDPSR